jgi:hypothetical protein
MNKLLLFILLSSYLFSASLDGNKLKQFCKEKSKIGSAFCHAYIGGFNDAIDIVIYLMDNNENNTTLIPKLPNKISKQQVVDIVKKHLEDNPKTLHYPASYLILESELDSFNIIQIKKSNN